MVLGLEGTSGLGAPLTKGTACRAPTGIGREVLGEWEG